MKILVTGGTGYIAGAVVSELLHQSPTCEIIVADRDLRAAHEVMLFQDARIELQEFDLLNPESFSVVLKKVNAVVHLAALNYQESFENIEMANKVNHLGTANFLESCIKRGVDHFIYFSTFHLYTENSFIHENSPLKAGILEDVVVDPALAYAHTHYLAEKHLLRYHEKGAIKGSIFRLSNAIGAPTNPYSNTWMLVCNDLCRQAVTKRNLVLKSSGIQKRNFIPIKDVACAVYYRLFHGKDHDPFPVFNLGGDQSISILELATIIQKKSLEVLGFTPSIEIQEKNSKEAFDFTFCSDKIKSFGFRYSHSIESAVEDTLLFIDRVENFRGKSTHEDSATLRGIGN
ncbi:MAG: NAD(P)-dependent oxidoreductase [Oligoflexia bacterium]|nr:NAD(P)-dependent oxidoreductase [Oligoflexia bacterium]